MLDICAQTIELIQSIEACSLYPPIDLRRKVIVGQEPMIGLGRDDESAGNPEMKAVSHLSQVRHFTTDLVGHVLCDLGEGNDEGAFLGVGHRRKERVDPFLDLLERIKERVILFWGQLIEVFDHLEDIDGDGRASGTNEMHAKR